MQDAHGMSILRFDISNAFGDMPRDVIEQSILNGDPTLLQFFRMCYGTESQIALFGGPDELEFIPMAEGVKQGDATSAFLFCLGMDRAVNMINDAIREMRIDGSHVYAYMDDLTICAKTTDANSITNIVINAFTKIGLKINTDKSKIYTKDVGIFNLPVHDLSQPFEILGANISEDVAPAKAFEEQQVTKAKNYLTKLKELPLHPHLTYTLLRVCGLPRIHYVVSVTPPQNTTT